MRWFVFIFLVLPVFCFSQPTLDGYMKGKSNLDIALGGTFETFGNYFTEMNKTRPISRNSIAASLYGAYGITNSLDVQINIPYIYTAQDFSNFQDISFYLKKSILNKELNEKRSLRVMLAAGTAFPMTNYETEGLYAIGQQATAIDGRLILQCTRVSGFFIMLQGGYTHRFDPVPSSIPIAIKCGRATDKLYFDFWYDQQLASGGNDYANVSLDPTISFRTFGVSYGKLGGSIFKPLSTKSGIALSASYILWGRNVGQTIGVSFSYVLRLNLAG